jgi:hypothetical protein
MAAYVGIQSVMAGTDPRGRTRFALFDTLRSSVCYVTARVFSVSSKGRIDFNQAPLPIVKFLRCADDERVLHQHFVQGAKTIHYTIGSESGCSADVTSTRLA